MTYGAKREVRDSVGGKIGQVVTSVGNNYVPIVLMYRLRMPQVALAVVYGFRTVLFLMDTEPVIN